MGRHGMSRPGINPERVDQQTPPTRHDRWWPGTVSGILELRLETAGDGFVSPGTGRLALRTDSSGETVVQEAQRRAGRPVLPGSGIKGAVRTVYQMLSRSCIPGGEPTCSHQRNQGLSGQHHCEACVLFGTGGLSGRITFSDAEPLEGSEVEEAVEWTPVPHEPHAEHTQGQFRIYDRREARAENSNELAEKVIAREVFRGSFRCRLRFLNASEEELGRLLLCMGTSTDPATSFNLRLGGVKYDGQGAMTVSPIRLRLVSPEREIVEAEECAERCESWRQAALDTRWSRIFLPKLKELAGLLEKGAEALEGGNQ